MRVSLSVFLAHLIAPQKVCLLILSGVFGIRCILTEAPDVSHLMFA